MKIFGAGLAGLLAGCAFPEAELFEAGDARQSKHKAVLRFRTPSVGEAVGIEFRKVRVNKGLWFDGRSVLPTIQTANWYSLKVAGRLFDRSIWNLDPVDRWIAPEDLLPQLAARCASRIHWSTPVTDSDIELHRVRGPIISTLPMPIMLALVGSADTPSPRPTFDHLPITVQRWRIPDADVFQTVYFPNPDVSLYRASITGNLLIAESVGAATPSYHEQMFAAFGLVEDNGEPLGSAKQSYGKIAPINEHWRKAFIFELSQRHSIFSLGRFGTWRNILLDDVLHDIGIVRRLIGQGSYDRAKYNAGVRASKGEQAYNETYRGEQG